MTYTHGHHESVLRSRKWRTVDNSAAYLASRLTTGTSVLDLGCGPGTTGAVTGIFSGMTLKRMDNVGVVVDDLYRLCYVRGPEGILVALAEKIG